MEVGAVKQAFNNEIIQLKKNLNQAKTQTIHKLTRKAKTLTEKKCPENLKDKLKRKAESAVREVLIIKKVKARDIARFIVTHTGKLSDYLNKPTIDNDKACARLLLHKALQEKYKHIRGKFSNISIDDLFMSRQERLKLKKEEREKQKNKKKRKEENRKKGNSNAVNVEGEWDVDNADKNKDTVKEKILINDKELSEGDDLSEIEDKTENDNVLSDKSDVGDESDESDHSEECNELNGEDIKQNDNDSDENDNDDEINNEIVLNKYVKNNSKSEIDSVKSKGEVFELKIKQNNKSSENKTKKVGKKIKDSIKNKNFNAKLQKRKFNKVSDDIPESKKVLEDSFFVTPVGDNYRSLVEPRDPDEVKEEHKRGNRKYRRAVMFGHVLKTKPKKNGFKSNNRFNKSDNFETKSNYKNKEFQSKHNNFGSKEDTKIDRKDVVPEKLHPSWEAKKKQSAILPFQGKKIVFD
ncbi:unnamed protein product [Euphydryas editha]|uniref:Serum response factor-binding protein 1 n=1 Tax=Euphydryas editha TaxID=104508 RepID=A0AAU9TMG1_EUPED|nr:unnamed protein product [Euphydryas editha]